jgi:uncharacterized protein (DUF924 family)
MHALRGDQLQNLWTSLWFAKGALTAPLDNRLRETYSKTFETVAFATDVSAPLPAPPVDLINEEMRLLWHLGLAVLCDQVSRNAFRGTPSAYRFDGLARRIAQAELRPLFDKLPVAMRMSVILIYIHSEDIDDVSVVEDLLARLRFALEPLSPFVWSSLTAIASNHRDRMQQFGRVCERNVILGR